MRLTTTNNHKPGFACACAIFIVGLVCSGSAHGAIRSYDELSAAVYKAGTELASGQDRQQVLDHLQAVLQKYPASTYQDFAQQLANDLDHSIHQAPSTLPDVLKPVMDTTIPTMWVYRENERAWSNLIKLYPSDPTAHLLGADRNVIDKLIPMLLDLSPTRSFENEIISGDLPEVPRVCDYALLAIQLHSRCRFHFNESTATPFHAIPVDDRTKVIQRIREWWLENRNRSVADGIRAQLPQGGYYAKIWMAEQLAGLDEGDRAANRADAIDVLKTLVAENNGVPAALALARLGDLSPMKQFRQRCLDALEKPGYIIESAMVFYMTDHGTRQDWELLNRLAQRELEQGKDAGSAGVWTSLVNCSKAATSPFAIPGLALALTQTEKTGSRAVDATTSQSFSKADTATEHLQNLTGVNFGYQPAASDAERSAAIARAQAWWIARGSKQYTFALLEKSAAKDGAKSEKVEPPSPTKE